MFQIEYLLKRNGPVYNPRYPSAGDIDNNIFLFRGKNDLGKSTTMQVIAMGLFGLSSEDIKDEIKAKMKRLISPETESFSFSFKIGSLDKKSVIESNLKEKNIEGLRVLLNNRVLSKTEFLDNYKLIFDIPDEVTKKLSDSLISVKTQIMYYSSLIRSYKGDLQRLIDDIDTFEKKEIRLVEHKQELERLNNIVKNYRERLNAIEPKYYDKRKIFIVKNYRELGIKIDNSYYIMKNLEKKIDPKIQKQKRSRFTNASENFLNALKNFRKEMDTFENLCKDLSFSAIMAELASLRLSIKRLNDPEELKKEQLIKYSKSLDRINEYFKQSAYNKSSKEENELELLEKVIEVMKSYVSINPEIPGTNGKSLNQFLEDIEQRAITLRSKLLVRTRFKNAQFILSSLLKQIDELVTLRGKIPMMGTYEQEDSEEIESKIKEKEKEIEILISLQSKIEAEYESLTEEEKSINYDLFDLDAFKSLEEEYNKVKEILKDSEPQIEVEEKFIKELENTTRAPTKLSRNDLNKQSQLINNIQDKIQKWNSNLNNIDGANIIDKKNIDDESHNFYDSLGRYLGNILEYIFFENNKWELEKIDLIKDSFIVKNRKPIMFIDIGTGNTALNSLMARIKQNYGGKKKILLLDDIGLMDNLNINRLIAEIKKQVLNGEVLLAILSIADRDLENVSVEPIQVP